MSMRVRFTREHGGNFVATTSMTGFNGRVIYPRLCGSVTTRLFGLVPGAYECTAVFTKTQPTCKRFYRLKKTKTHWLSDFENDGFHIKLANFKGGFLIGVPELLRAAYAKGHRYVRIQS